MSEMSLSSNLESKLINHVNSLSVGDANFWSFRGRSTRHHCHALFQYPAMMVPQMQGVLIDSMLKIDPEIDTIYDPFIGVGTTLGECMTRGLNCVGQDINPLAILACSVKKGPFFIDSLEEKIKRLIQSIKQDKSLTMEVDFMGIDKWFLPEVQVDLSKIYRSILKEEKNWARRFFWLTMASTVRATCNSRSSTYKLHIKALDDLKVISPIEYFVRELKKNLEHLKATKILLQTNGLLSRGNQSHYQGEIAIEVKDIQSGAAKHNKKFDLVISSPPYGDNQTTVPYGQFSYLPLKWINVKDIDSKLSHKNIQTQSSIDSSSLGGTLKGSDEKCFFLSSISPAFKKCVDDVAKIEVQNIKKIASFIFDLHAAMEKIVPSLKEQGHMVWTLGNRRVSNIEVPLNYILREILESMNCSFVHELEREIPSKRMAAKNRNSPTMTKETVLIMKKFK